MFYWPLQQNSPIISTTWFACVFVPLMIPFEAVLSQLQTTSQESHHFRKTNSPSLEAIDLLMSFFQSPTLHLPLWVVSSASEIRFLYIPLLSESKRDLAKWFQWHSAAFRVNDLNCMYSQEMTPWYWYCILICIAFFSQSFYNCTVSESSNLIQLESFIITCTVFH